MTSTTEVKALQDYTITVTFYTNLPADTPDDQVQDLLYEKLDNGELDFEDMEYQAYSTSYNLPGVGLATLLT